MKHPYKQLTLASKYSGRSIRTISNKKLRMKKHSFQIIIVGASLMGILTTGCNKILEIKDPVNSITTNQVFQNDDQAAVALNGLYSYLISGGEKENASQYPQLGNNLYSAGGVTMAAAHLADEMYHPALNGQYLYYAETAARVTLLNPGFSTSLWSSAYKAVFNANALIEGTFASESKEYTIAARNRVMGEALTVRAMSYFYLVNFFKQIPLAMSVDFNDTRGLPSADSATVYQQINADLEAAIGYLSEKYEGNNAERIRINKWYAKALLARVSLFTKNYAKAYEHANDIINQTTLFKLEPLNNVFTYNSEEVIFQLKQTNNSIERGNATPEGFAMTERYLTPTLLNSFETGDNRKTAWISEITGSVYVPAGFSPAKYKINALNQSFEDFRSEYYVVARLAEMYLIRAEAAMLGGAGSKNNAIDDLNAVRERAGLTIHLPYTLSDEQVIDAIAQERRIELFAEWGHRWLDLKRTNKANQVLSSLFYKQPWDPTQLLYPIPTNEIKWNNNLSQNNGYR